DYDGISITNTGAIDATSQGANFGAYGIVAHNSDTLLGDVTVDNTGDITATAYGAGAHAYGINLYGYGTINNTVTNGGLIVPNAYGANGIATGIYAFVTDGALTIDSSASITAYGQGHAYGIHGYLSQDRSVATT